LMYSYFTHLPIFPIQTHPGLVINQVQEVAMLSLFATSCSTTWFMALQAA
jgi:hypothetical protein